MYTVLRRCGGSYSTSHWALVDGESCDLISFHLLYWVGTMHEGSIKYMVWSSLDPKATLHKTLVIVKVTVVYHQNGCTCVNARFNYMYNTADTLTIIITTNQNLLFNKARDPVCII